MATRFYLRASAAPSVSPAFHSTWTNTASATRRAMATTKLAGDTLAVVSASFTTGQYCLLRQYVSEPMVAGLSIDGILTTTDAVARCYEGVANDNLRMVGVTFVVSQDGTTLRYDIGGLANSNEPTVNPILETRKFLSSTSAGGGGYTTVAGDRLVVEFGFTDVAGTTPLGAIEFGSDAALSDLPNLDFQATTDVPGTLVPWYEIVLDGAFTPPAPPPPAITPGPVSFPPIVPSGGFGGQADWPSLNPQAQATQLNIIIPNNSVKDEHIVNVSARKLLLVGIKVFRSTTQSMTDGVSTSITYDSVTFRKDFADPGGSFTTVVAPYDGVYQLTGLIEFEANAVGSRQVEFMVNGAAIDGSRFPATPGGLWRCSFSSSQRLTAGDTVGVRVTQNSGGALNVNAGVVNDALTVIFQGGI